MTSQMEKFLRRLTESERNALEDARQKIVKKEWETLDMKILKGSSDIARVRVGRHRILFSGIKTGNLKIQKITKRDENTYR